MISYGKSALTKVEINQNLSDWSIIDPSSHFPNHFSSLPASDRMPRLFVYGTLLRGLENAPLLLSETFLFSAKTVPQLYMISNENVISDNSGFSYEPSDIEPNEKYKYPFLMREAIDSGAQTASCITGEVYDVCLETLTRIDGLEDHPDVYRRQQMDICALNEDGSEGEVQTDVELYVLENKEVIADVAKYLSKDPRYKIVNGGSWMSYVKGI